MISPISSRGSSQCRCCTSDKLSDVLNLGLQPIPSEYGSTPEEVLESFPLHLRICQECGLGQLGEYVLPDRIFHKSYPYLSSASSTWVNHARQYATAMTEKLNLNHESLVIEIASNDGYLLSEFKKNGIPVIGVEPAENVASIAENSGIFTLTEFFGAQLAKDIISKFGHPRLVAANNVFAHIPDMLDFTEGLSVLADNNTIITIENPSFALLLKNNLFDTIYHEHYSYLSAHSVRVVAGKFGLNLFHIDKLQTHGGSNRYWLSKSMDSDESVETVLHEELSDGLFDPNQWASFAERSIKAIDDLRAWFNERKQNGDVVAAYGAAHKGNSFLNAVGDASKNLIYAVDASHEKQGKYLPGSQVPVIAPEQLNSGQPTDVLILPWNIASEIREQIRKFAPNARIWVAQPNLHQL
jgi:hypothetical protein